MLQSYILETFLKIASPNLNTIPCLGKDNVVCLHGHPVCKPLKIIIFHQNQTQLQLKTLQHLATLDLH